MELLNVKLAILDSNDLGMTLGQMHRHDQHKINQQGFQITSVDHQFVAVSFLKPQSTWKSMDKAGPALKSWKRRHCIMVILFLSWSVPISVGLGRGQAQAPALRGLSAL